jgi:hypothetical protein
MKHWRHILVAAWLALALVGGQQLVVLHALGHATDRITNKDKDSTATCKIHFACSQLANAMGGKAPALLPVPLAQHAGQLPVELAFHTEPVLAFHSRGPPASSV